MIKHIRILAVIAAVAGLTVFSCGGGQTPTPPKPDSLLSVVEAPGLSRTSDIRVYVGDSLWEYINGGAELYHSYNFAEVATADYSYGGAELLLDIYLFDSDDNAFGLYSQLRPEVAGAVPLGAAGFSSQTNIVFLKGPYVVMVTGFAISPQTAAGISAAGAVLNRVVPGRVDLPDMFDRLPSQNAVPYSEKMFAESFLGESALTNVYTRDYNLGGETVTLFLTADYGDKFNAWKERQFGRLITVDLGLPPDNADRTVASDHDYYGQIVAMGKSGYLAGAVGYTDTHRDLVSGWLQSIED